MTGQCCLVCVDLTTPPTPCVEGETKRGDGDPCQRCRCIGGEFQCFHDQTICPQDYQNSEEVPFGDTSNPRCVERSTQINRETCERCMCISGAFQCYRDPSVCPQVLATADLNLNCTNVQCPRTECPSHQIPRNVTGQCCLVCVDLTTPPTPCVEGETKRGDNDPCQRCRCIGGEFRCFHDQTICSQDYQNSEEVPFGDTSNPMCVERSTQVNNETCERCMCISGAFQCYRDPSVCPQTLATADLNLNCTNVQCPRTECPSHQIPRNVTGQCCLVCVDLTTPPTPCVEGETKRGDDDPCQRCRCIGGEFRCFHDQTICPQDHQNSEEVTSNPSCVERSTQINRETCERCMCISGTFQCYRDPSVCPQNHQNSPRCIERSTQINHETCERCMCIGGAFQCYRDLSVCPQSHFNKRSVVVLPKTQFITKTQRRSSKLNQDGVDIKELNEEPKERELSSTYTQGKLLVCTKYNTRCLHLYNSQSFIIVSIILSIIFISAGDRNQRDTTLYILVSAAALLVIIVLGILFGVIATLWYKVNRLRNLSKETVSV